MAYAYIKGAELPALHYYESLLMNTPDTDERSKIEGILQDIRNALLTKHQLEQGEFINLPAPLRSANLSANEFPLA
jgi:hypothetical protein